MVAARAMRSEAALFARKVRSSRRLETEPGICQKKMGPKNRPQKDLAVADFAPICNTSTKPRPHENPF